MCLSVSLICFTSCAAAAPVSNRARARSAENNTPRNPRHVDTAYPFRMSDMAWSSISIGCTPTRQRKPEEWRAGTCHDAPEKTGERNDNLSGPTGVDLLKVKVPRVGIWEVSRPAEGFATGRDFASTGSGSSRPRNYIVSQQNNVGVASQYRAGHSLGKFGTVRSN